MLSGEIVWNLLLMLLCYGYVVFIIIVTSRMPLILDLSRKSSRKFLHAMIGNILFVIPFFTRSIFPALVAAPFILLTFLASPYSPIKSPSLQGLVSITEEGHPLGLVFYAVSYTVLAFFFASKPAVVAAGILPMAYGDSAASLVGEKYGNTKRRLVGNKSLEGSTGMFFGSLFSLTVGLVLLFTIHSLAFRPTPTIVVAVAIVVTLVESVSPKGFDNLTVPFLGALSYLILSGGI